MKKCIHENVPLKNLYKVFLSLKDEPIWLGMWSFCEWMITEELLSAISSYVDGLIFLFKILMLCMFIFKFIW